MEVQFPAIKQHVETFNTEIVASLSCQESTDENFIAITESNQAIKSSDSSIASELFCFGKNSEKKSAQRGVLRLGKAVGVSVDSTAT